MTPRRPGWAALGWLACAAAARAGSPALEAAHTVERLSSGFSAWRSSELVGQWHEPDAWTASSVLRRTERFDLIDSQVEAGIAVKLAAQWRGEAELADSATHRILPAWRWRGRLWREGVAGWNVALGAGRTLYRRDGAAQGNSVAELQAERYVTNWRFGWAGSVTRLDAGGASSVHVGRANWYANERLTLGAAFTVGRELENTPITGVVSSSVRSATLKAQWAYTPVWSFSAEVSSHRQGALYERNGLRLGLRLQH